MAYTRKQVADTIKHLRYAARTGACSVAHFHLRTLSGEPMRSGTWERLQNTVNRCVRALHYNAPNRRRRR